MGQVDQVFRKITETFRVVTDEDIIIDILLCYANLNRYRTSDIQENDIIPRN